MMAQNVHYSCISENDCFERHSKAKCRHFFVIFDHKNGKNGSARVQEVSHRGSNCNWNGIFAIRKSSSPIHGSYGSEDGAALPLDVGMALAHQPMDQIFISLAQMVHFSWETPLIIPDFGISKISALGPTLLDSSSVSLFRCYVTLSFLIIVTVFF